MCKNVTYFALVYIMINTKFDLFFKNNKIKIKDCHE